MTVTHSGWSTPNLSKQNGLPLGEVVLFGMLGALTFALQVVMAPLPNIEPVSLLVMLFAVTYGWKSMYPVYVFVMMEVLFHGIGLWNINYLYVWTVLAVVAITFRKMDSALGWALLSGAFGLGFGALCGIVDIFIGGFPYAIAKWISGIPFDLLHCGGNFALTLVLWKPLRNLIGRLGAKQT